MALPVLGAETWGERLLRARRRSGVSLEEAAARIGQIWPVSYSTLMRLEGKPEAPSDRKRRAVAFLAALVYGIDPNDFGLYTSDLPPRIGQDELAELLSDRLATASSAKPGYLSSTHVAAA